MKYTEKIFVLGTFGLSILYIVMFNLNLPHYWNNSPQIVPEIIIDSLWLICLVLSLLTLIVCIRDSGKRKLNNRAGWIAYMLLMGGIGVPHYYFKHGRYPYV